ncbi:hypothetical protein ACOME3_003933 [Neoechinorhynchus agilis]
MSSPGRYVCRYVRGKQQEVCGAVARGSGYCRRGPKGGETIRVEALGELSSRLQAKTGNTRAGAFRRQNIGLAIQRGNAAKMEIINSYEK